MKKLILISLLLSSSLLFAESIDNNPLTEFKTASDYLNGTHGRTKSAVIAIDLFSNLAQQGYPMAQYMLGTLYLEGRGVENNTETAIVWLSLAAEQHFLPAVRKLSEIKERNSFQELDRENVAIIEQ